MRLAGGPVLARENGVACPMTLERHIEKYQCQINHVMAHVSIMGFILAARPITYHPIMKCNVVIEKWQ